MPRGKKKETEIKNNETVTVETTSKPREQEVDTAGTKVKVNNKKVPGRPKGHGDSEETDPKEYSFVYRDTKNRLNRKVFKVYYVIRKVYDESTGKKVEAKVKHTRLDRIEKDISPKDAMK